MQPRERLPEVLASGDLHVIPLKAGLARRACRRSCTRSSRPGGRWWPASTPAPRWSARSSGPAPAWRSAPTTRAFTLRPRRLLDDPAGGAPWGAPGRRFVESLGVAGRGRRGLREALRAGAASWARRSLRAPQPRRRPSVRRARGYRDAPLWARPPPSKKVRAPASRGPPVPGQRRARLPGCGRRHRRRRLVLMFVARPPPTRRRAGGAARRRPLARRRTESTSATTSRHPSLTGQEERPGSTPTATASSASTRSPRSHAGGERRRSALLRQSATSRSPTTRSRLPDGTVPTTERRRLCGEPTVGWRCTCGPPLADREDRPDDHHQDFANIRFTERPRGLSAGVHPARRHVPSPPSNRVDKLDRIDRRHRADRSPRAPAPHARCRARPPPTADPADQSTTTAAASTRAGGRPGRRLRHPPAAPHPGLPKQMLPVVGLTMIERVVPSSASTASTTPCSRSGYRPDAFIAAYPDGTCAGRRAALRGGARAARHRRAPSASPPLDAGIDERFIVVNGDVLTDLDISDLCAHHERFGARRRPSRSPASTTRRATAWSPCTTTAG